jgi:hypothetical protein
MTKSDFVRSMGSTKASDIVAAAKKQGMKLTERYVYVIRSSDKRRGRAPVARGRRGRGTSSSEAELRRAIAELGLTKARAIFREVEATFSR